MIASRKTSFPEKFHIVTVRSMSVVTSWLRGGVKNNTFEGSFENFKWQFSWKNVNMTGEAVSDGLVL